MTSYRFSVAAEADIEAIIDFTVRMWGFDQARKYASGLYSTCERLAAMPRIGKRAKYAGADVRCFPHQSHVIYYRIEGTQVVVVAILHVRQDPALRFDNDG